MRIANGVVEIVSGGSLVLALPLALLAGLISFLSPCVLPLVPGYLSLAAGTAGLDSKLKFGNSRTRTFWSSVLFVIGFSTVFISFGTLFGSAGKYLIQYQNQIQIVGGLLIITLGIAFLGFISPLQREIRIHKIPRGTYFGALIMGITFGIGWTPCIGPTLATVQTMAISEADAVRGAILSAAFSLGLGIPFIAFGVAMQRGMKVIKFLRGHSKTIVQFGALMLIVIGLLLVTGYWNEITIYLRIWATNWTGWLL